MIDWTSVLGDLAKGLAQGGSALLIGWLAVRWALARYKEEKLWERRLQAYQDALAAIDAMSRAVHMVGASKGQPEEIRSWGAKGMIAAEALLAFPASVRLLFDEAESLSVDALLEPLRTHIQEIGISDVARTQARLNDLHNSLAGRGRAKLGVRQ